MNKFYCFIFSLSLLTQITLVRAANQVRSRASFGETTDKIDYRELSVTGIKNERDLNWPYLNELDNDESLSLDYFHRYQNGQNFKFRFNEISGSYSKILKEKHRLTANLGLYSIDEEAQASQETKVSGGVTILSKPTKNLLAKVALQRGSSLRSIFLTGPNLHVLKATSVNTRLQYQFFKQVFSIQADIIKHFLADSVERTYFDAEFMAALMKFPHWVRVGFGYHTLDFNKNTQNYWSPIDFYAFGPRLDLSYVFNSKFQVFLGGNYSWFEENKSFKGTGYYMSTGFRYGIREDFTIDLSYERNESVQNNNSWVANSYFLNLAYFL